MALHPSAGVIIDRIQRDRFMNTGQAVPVTEEGPNTLDFVACGQPLAEHQIRVVDQHGRELPERQEGRLSFKGHRQPADITVTGSDAPSVSG
ncbi:MAG: hypothetical protein R3F37_09300 [Candidatus Competibacteraceae bacterium]